METKKTNNEINIMETNEVASNEMSNMDTNTLSTEPIATTQEIPSKIIFMMASKIYADANQLAPTGRNFEAACNVFNKLNDKYDFRNHVEVDEAGREYVAWCWGEKQTQNSYDKIVWFQSSSIPEDRCFSIGLRNGMAYLINPKGEEVYSANEIRPNIGSIVPSICREGEKWGIVNSKGEYIIKPQYDKISSELNGFWFLELNGKHGFITPFNELFEPVYDKVGFDDLDFLTVSLGGKVGYIDEEGEFTEDLGEACYHLQMCI